MTEHERHGSIGAQIAAVLGKCVTHLGHRSGAVVGHAVDDDRCAADAVAFVADFFVARAVQATRTPLDGALDGVLGIEHQRDELREYLMEMRTYMPPKHVAFIEAVERGPSVREMVKKVNRRTLTSLFNTCVEIVGDFRAKHLEYAGTYIHAQAQATPGNPSAVGTGGTPFMVYLRKHRDETRAQMIN